MADRGGLNQRGPDREGVSARGPGRTVDRRVKASLKASNPARAGEVMEQLADVCLGHVELTARLNGVPRSEDSAFRELGK